MKKPFKQFTLDDVRHATHFKKEYIAGLHRFFDDPGKEKRLAVQECVYCYYAGKMGGAAVTYSPCGLCEKEMGFASTCTDALCIDCAKNHNLCKHCGADMQYKKRNKL